MPKDDLELKKAEIDKRIFLEHYATKGVVAYAAQAANRSIRWIAAQRKIDPDFAQKYQQAFEIAADNLELEAHRRAVDGVPKKIFQRGQLVGEVREYSDPLLMFLLRGMRPEKYRDNPKREPDWQQEAKRYGLDPTRILAGGVAALIASGAGLLPQGGLEGNPQANLPEGSIPVDSATETTGSDRESGI